MQETQTMEQTNLCEVKRRGGADMWDKRRVGHVGGVNQICYVLQGLCEPCKVYCDVGLSLYVYYVYMC
jgi:hypothetical protein